MPEEMNARIESELEVQSYIQNLKYALNNGVKIDFQVKRLVDERRDVKFVMSVHFAEKAFTQDMFPYKK